MGLDHLVYATPDVDRTVEDLAQRFGVRAAPGGRHPGLGTRNALIALGAREYLEIIGPGGDEEPRWFGIDTLRAPKLVAWAAKDTALELRVKQAADAGFPLGPVEAGSRVRLDGVRLSWRFTHPRILAAGGVVPFFIDWGAGAHPAGGAPSGVTLVELRAQHPEPPKIAALLQTLGVEGVKVDRGGEPRLFATFDTPRGRFEL